MRIGINVEAPYGALKAAKSKVLIDAANYAVGRYREEPRPELKVAVSIDELDLEDVQELAAIIKDSGDAKDYRALAAITQYAQGDFDKKVPNFKAFPKGLSEYLQQSTTRGWVFMRSGKHYLPYAIANVRYDAGDPSRQVKPNCTLSLEAFGPSDGYGSRSRSFTRVASSRTWEPSDVTHKTISQILWDAGIFLDSQELLDQYDATLERWETDILPRFPQQLVCSSGFDEDEMPSGSVRKVIHDLKVSEVGSRPIRADSRVLNSDPLMPVHAKVHTFDLSNHSFAWRHSDDLVPYVYDKTLRNKLILPTSHRDLLDVLTSDLSAFSGDIIAGKSAGNIIVCKGLPGLGKTLTAEVYSELTDTPIYAVHSGTMGTTPSEVEKSLKTIFQRQRRWGCIVLLDEADVFVMRRGSNLVQNAIVAEFLRTLEYFEGLMFMTTNRADDIDDAIISRAAAIITYNPPGPDHAKRIWNVMFDKHGVKPPKGLVPELIELFPGIAPRDIKMLLRLTLRVAANKDVPLTADLFRRIAMFRNVTIRDTRKGATIPDDNADLI